MTRSTQLSLDRPEWFRPIPDEPGHYVPAVQTLKGERDALAHASVATWQHLTPLILVQARNPKTGVFTRSQVSNWVKELARAVGAHPFFLGLLTMRANHPTDIGRPVLALIFEQARKRNLMYVPVLRIGASNATVALVREATSIDGRGIALRYPLFSSASTDGRSPQTIIKDSLAAVEMEPECADLLLDAGHISSDVDLDPDDVSAVINDFIGLGRWRSVVLLGTAMERSLGGGIVEEGTVGRLPRREWRLWTDLRAAQPKLLPTFGDYAVQHPERPAQGQSGPGMRANIRYTLDDVTLVPRGRGAIHEAGAEQYRGLCRQIVEDSGFAGPEYTWGDRLIYDCARGIGEPGWQQTWRGAGTSHHLKHVVDQLRRLN